MTDLLAVAARAAPDVPTETARLLYVPLFEWLCAQPRDGAPLVVAISGLPGTGKSTASRVVGELLQRITGVTVASLSLDDVYLSRAARAELATRVHPLLAFRGVPGTHDLQLAHSTLDALNAARTPDRVPLPRFDKLQDDRLPSSAWPRVAGPVDVVLLDGWFWNVRAQSAESLKSFINARESRDDPDGRFRSFVNTALERDYPALFVRAARHVRLIAPSFESSIRWRVQQEQQLLRHSGAARDPTAASRIEEFLQLFERVGKLVPVRRADVVVELDENHGVAAFTAN